MRAIAGQEPRDNPARIPRDVEAGERVRVTLDGRPVGEIVPIEDARRTYGPREAVMQLLARVPLPADVVPDVGAVIGRSVEDELRRQPAQLGHGRDVPIARKPC